MFIHQTTIRLHHTDAAGLLFFADQFKLAHDAYESFMESIGYPFAPLLRTSQYLLPIVHAEADYGAALSTGDKITIQVTAERVGDTSFTLTYRLLRDGNEPVGSVKTVHVLVDKRTGQTLTLLPDLRTKLAAIAATA
ncbi:MAG: acyl-CoA thioesterase [bacterium]|nr:acyl-CoA thioesterase [bacterium]